MQIILLFSILLMMSGFTLFITKKFKTDFGASWTYSTFIIISMLYLGALLHILTITVSIIYITGILFFSYYCISWKKNKDLFINSIYTFLSLILCTYISYFLTRKIAIYTAWDDYAFWGVILKELHVYGELLVATDITSILESHRHYTKAAILFQYMITKILPYTETNAIFSNSFLCICFAAVVLRNRITSNILLITLCPGPLFYFPPSSLKTL